MTLSMANRDLQLGDKKGTLNHLEESLFFFTKWKLQDIFFKAEFSSCFVVCFGGGCWLLAFWPETVRHLLLLK